MGLDLLEQRQKSGVKSDQFKDYLHSPLRVSWDRKMGMESFIYVTKYLKYTISITITIKGTDFGIR